MNQDQVKKTLLDIEDAPQEFSVIFSGKKSRKVNGLYKVDSREIILHNRNFEAEGKQDANLLLYTAIHEYAHHLHACARGGHLSTRAHTQDFWAIFHGLLEKAEKRKIYENRAALSPRLEALAEAIRQNLVKNGGILKELGGLLRQALEVCQAEGARYEEYVDRVLRIPRQAAALAIKMRDYDLDPQTGPDNMRWLAGIRDQEDRQAAQKALIGGKSPDAVRVAQRSGTPAGGSQEPDRLESLEKEKFRLERTIDGLSRRLREVESEIDRVQTKNS